MIFEFILGVVKTVIVGAISRLDFISLPFEIISFLGTVTNYGSFCVGPDVLLIFSASIMFWLGLKMTLGIILFLWRLLPFT